MTSALIDGPTELPVGFDHPHASEQARDIATRGMILRVQVGSGVHGTSISGQDDRDEMGICLEPAEYVTGLARVPAGTATDASTVPFEQYERHTVWGGEVALGEVIAAVSAAEIRLGELRNSSSLPDEPDRAWIDRWLHRRHLEYWARRASDGAG